MTRINVSRLSELKEKIEKLNKKAAKLGAEPVYVNVGEPYSVETVNDLDFKVIRHYVDVETVGEAPKLAGWAFIGTLEHTEAGVITRSVPGTEIPASFRAVEKLCQHCNKTRSRKATYVVQHESGETLQVGSSCLKDFLGHQSPEQLANWASVLINLPGEIEEGFGGGRGGEDFFATDYVLTLAAAAIREHGWVSRSVANTFVAYATANRVIDHLTYRPGDKLYAETRLHIEDVDEQRAEQALAFVLIEEGDGSDYVHNLSIAAQREALPIKDFGIACSIISYVERQVGIEAERREARESKTNEWIANVGEKVDLELTLSSVKEIASDFGVSTLYKFEDTEGRAASWFSSRDLDLSPGSTYKLKGTVKDHTTYNERRETRLTRCKIA